MSAKWASWRKTYQSAFTIVELLIVIVVIGILAAIVTVAYNGVAQRAYNIQVIAGVRSYYDAIKSYYALNGSYPQTGPEQAGDRIAMTCLGRGYPNQSCGIVTASTRVYEDALFNQQMQTIGQSPNSPLSKNNTLLTSSGSFVGAVYGIDEAINTSTGYGRVIGYGLIGANMNCGISGAYAWSSNANSTACEILLEEVPAR